MFTLAAGIRPSVGQVARVVFGLLAPIAVPLLALVLHQAGMVTIPWTGGAVAVVIVAGFVCGVLLRSALAVAWIFVIWLVWAIVAIAIDNGPSELPVGSTVISMLFIIALPAMVAALLGVLAARGWQSR